MRLVKLNKEVENSFPESVRQVRNFYFQELIKEKKERTNNPVQ